MQGLFSKKYLLFLLLLLLPCSLYATDGVSTVPVLFFSDLTSGPATGGKNNAGVFISIYGRNFGAERGTSTVTVNTVEASNYEVWLDTYVAFQMGSGTTTGNIILTTSAGASNTLPFTVRAGNIYFVDASTPTAGDGSYGNMWQSPRSYCDAIKSEDGATCYIKAGTYTGLYSYTTGGTNVMLDTNQGGVAGQENAFCGYPGEIAYFKAATGETATKLNFNAHTQTTYIVIANLSMYGEQGCIKCYDYWRMVGNKCDGIKVLSSTGIIASSNADTDPDTDSATGVIIYGNELTGITSGNKLDHAIYLKNGSNIDVGWNYFYDNDCHRGPIISNNHDSANLNGWDFENYHIHDNIIDMSAHPSRAVGIADTGIDSTFYIYNNIIIGESHPEDDAPVMYANNSHAYYYNNTMYNIGNAGSWNAPFGFYAEMAEAIVKNNIIYSSSTANYYMQVENGCPAIINTNNCWYGIGSFADHESGDTGANTDAVEADPGFTSPDNANFVLLSTSTCIGKGLSTTEITDIAPKDFYGVTRPQGDSIDIGSLEYWLGTTGSITNKQLFNGTFYGGSF